jgi:hypothetical protein
VRGQLYAKKAWFDPPSSFPCAMQCTMHKLEKSIRNFNL